MIKRRDRVRERLDELNADALFVTKLVNARYLTGLSSSNAQLLVAGDDVLFTDTRYEEAAAKQAPDCRCVVYSTGGMATLLAEMLAERGVRRLAIEAHDMTVLSARVLASKLDSIELVETNGVVEHERVLKTPEEIEHIRRACSIGDAGFEALLGRLTEGMTEREAAAELEDSMRRAGSDGLSFDTIIAFGEQAAEPHHEPTDRTLQRGDMIKLDFGATSNGYHSDMTRTIAFGTPSDEAKRIHSIVYAAQRAGVEAVRAGAAAKDVDAASRDAVEAAGYSFGHGVGHGVGLEVHEAPGVRRESVDILAAGMAVTVEPGIYLPGFGGVRIEDTVAVTETGCEILTNSPRELIEV